MSFTSIYVDGSVDYRQMYDIQDVRGNLPVPIIHSNTLMSALTDPNVSEFSHIVNKTSLIGILNSTQGDFTLFIPVNGGVPNCYKNPDEYLCRRLSLLHMLEHAVAPPFIRGSKSMLVNTRIPGSRLLIENYEDKSGEKITMINRYSKVLSVKQFGNGIVYYLDKMILPESNPLTNVDI